MAEYRKEGDRNTTQKREVVVGGAVEDSGVAFCEV